MDNRFQKILVPVRTPDASGSAAQVATDLARRLRVELFLVLEYLDQSVSSEQRYSWIMAGDEDSSRTATADATALESKSGDPNELRIPVHGAHLTDNPAFTLGSVAEKVVRRARYPVFTLKARHSPVLNPGGQSSSDSE